MTLTPVKSEVKDGALGPSWQGPVVMSLLYQKQQEIEILQRQLNKINLSPPMPQSIGHLHEAMLGSASSLEALARPAMPQIIFGHIGGIRPQPFLHTIPWACQGETKAFLKMVPIRPHICGRAS